MMSRVVYMPPLVGVYPVPWWVSFLPYPGTMVGSIHPVYASLYPPGYTYPSSAPCRTPTSLHWWVLHTPYGSVWE